MALRPAYLLMNVEFDDFLFAPVGEQSNGMPLSVISALTRLDFDPWEKAGQLSKLTAKDASQALAALIARLPGGRWEIADASAIATRLVALLPRRPAPGGPPTDATSPPEKINTIPSVAWVVLLALLAAGLFGIMQSMDSRRHDSLPPYAASHNVAPPLVDK